MSIVNETQSTFSKGILSLLPIFYVGWSDSVLSPSEIKIIQDKLNDIDILTQEDRDYLIKYTDPLNPPSPIVFKSWVKAIKEYSQKIAPEEKLSLSELGMALIKEAYGHDSLSLSNKTAQAIKSIEADMGLSNQMSTNILLHTLDKESKETSSLFDSKCMQSILDGPYTEIRNKMRTLLSDRFFDLEYIANKEQYREQVLLWVKALADQGLGGYAFPQKYGGSDRPGEHMTIFEMLAYHDLSLTIKFGVQFGLFGGALYNLGTKRHHRKYVQPLIKADLLGCFAMTETGHGSNVKDLKTTATYDHDTKSLTINTPSIDDGKEYIGNALHGTMAAVFCQLIVKGESHGVHAVLVPYRNPDGSLMEGIKVEDCGYKMGLNGVDNGRLWFDQVSVPVENLLNKYGDIDDEGNYTSPVKNGSKRFFTMLGALVTGRICVGMAGVNTAKSALTIAIKHSSKRRQFPSHESGVEHLLMDYPSHQRRLIPRLAKTYAYHFALSNLINEYTLADESQQRYIESKAAGLKALATWHATDTIQECREACGGKGYLAENRISSLKADSDIFTTFEGDNTVLLQLVTKGLLTEYKQSFHDEGFMAVIKYLGKRFSHKIDENNPLYSRKATVEHLLDNRFHYHAFKYRKQKLLITLSNRMRDYLKKRISPFEAFLKCQNHMLDLAKAHIKLIVLDDFYQQVKAAEDLTCKNSLRQLAQLYALNSIEEDKGWFMENDYIEGVKAKSIRRVVNKLCQDLRPQVNDLVDAFGIPEKLISAPIAKG